MKCEDCFYYNLCIKAGDILDSAKCGSQFVLREDVYSGKIPINEVIPF